MAESRGMGAGDDEADRWCKGRGKVSLSTLIPELRCDGILLDGHFRRPLRSDEARVHDSYTPSWRST